MMNGNRNSAKVRIGTWNTMWARLDGWKQTRERGQRVKAALEAPGCDILCVTEGFPAILPDEGSLITAPQEWGYPVKDDRRKVLLWSKRPWEHVDRLGSNLLPGGRFLKGETMTAAGWPLTVVGVCIPWSGAHCSSGRKDRKRWQDHKIWLTEFEKLRSELPNSKTIVLGDFNQTIPRLRAPRAVYQALKQAFDCFEIATECELEGAPRLAIDHIAHTPDLAPGSIEIWPDRTDDDKFLSDHFGVWCDFTLA